jgi:chorismate synthase
MGDTVGSKTGPERGRRTVVETREEMIEIGVKEGTTGGSPIARVHSKNLKLTNFEKIWLF